MRGDIMVPLKVVSEYSLLKSTIKIDDLIDFLMSNNISSAAIVDDNLYGVMEFYKKMKSHNLKPIIGYRIKILDYELFCYAKNYNGYLNLLKINTLKEFGKLSLDSIKKYLSDIKVILPSNGYEAFNEFEGAYLGYTNLEEKIKALMVTDRVVYFRDVRALKKEDTKYLYYLEAINRGVLLKDINSDYQDKYLDLNVSFEDNKSTLDFISDIDITIINDKNYIPKYNDLDNSFLFLSNLANKGLYKRLNGNVLKNYQDRLNFELDVIKNMGFVDYFLIVYDYVLYAKKNDILVGPGRGSAAGSLVSYAIGITDVDPIEYNLLFERFLNPDRITMPDIDIDFEYIKRGRVIDYVRDKYGFMNVAPIMTFGTLGSKQVIRDVGRVMDTPLNIIDKLSSLLDAKVSLKENYKNSQVKEFVEKEELLDIYKVAIRLEGFKRHISTHAAGVVISSVSLDEVIPIIKSNDGIITGVTMEYLEELGLLKMDFLALRNLTIIANVLELIYKNTNKRVDLNKIKLDDEDVYKLFCAADTEGIFQYESSGMKNLMRKLKPTCFSDLVAAVALFRPGPMDNIDMFIKRKQGLEKVLYLHPDLEPILKETYGVIVYQEQVMQILVKIGGFSLSEADNIRRAMSKKKEDVILKSKNDFINGAVKLGYKKDIAVNIYDLILKFANYGFNKAHSVSYALIGYRMAYLKVKEPVYFILNLLNMSIGSEVKTKEYIDEAKAKNINILKPNINKSTNFYEVVDEKIMLPLSSVKNLGVNAVLAIIEERKNGEFKDYLDFVARVYGKSVNKKTICALIDAGVLDSFNLTKKTMVENLDIVVNYASLVSDLDQSLVNEPVLQEYMEYEEDILREKELESYGFYVENHPVNKYQDKSLVKINDISKYFDKYIKMVVLVEKVRKIKTKKNDNMAFLTVTDETGSTELVVFPKGFVLLNNIGKNDILLVNGKVTKRFDMYQINVEYLEKK